MPGSGGTACEAADQRGYARPVCHGVNHAFLGHHFRVGQIGGGHGVAARLTTTTDLIREAANGFETGTFSAWTSHVNDNAPYLIGTANPNVLPCPGTPSLETHTLPPCWTITVLTIANPNPTPGMASVVSPRTR